MQIALEVALIIATQVGTTTALSLMIRGINHRLDRQNGSIDKMKDWQQTHIENCHTGNKK